METLLDQLYIFEMANNHQGSVAHGLKIIEMVAQIARKHQIKAAVKLQLRDLDTFIHPDYKGRTDVKHIGRFESTRLSMDEFRQLINAIRDHGLLTVATPFDEQSVQTCQALNVQVLKLASCSATDWPLISAMINAKKPVIASTGGLGIYDIDNLVSHLHKRVPAFALMHCVSLYPTPDEHIHMNFLSKIMRRYPYVLTGYSGHEAPDNNEVTMAAIAKGAHLLERHVGVATPEIKLNAYSLDAKQADNWIAAAERMRAICGENEEKHVTQNETDALRELQRGVFVKRAIRKGEKITPEDVYFAMPRSEGQLTSGEFGQLRAQFVASRDYAVNTAVFEPPRQDTMRLIRGILHDAKGQLYESGIALGEDYTVEISHHYGLERFRETGCILINLINREYCYKVLIMLPGQKHPPHMHKQKEETFCMLWGDLTVNLPEQEAVHLKPGDKLLVQRNTMHDFSTLSGAIFAEVSTHSIVGDSYYANPEIAELDPMQRKTILDNW
ncbi:N-acetylneuraminate synthase family protein [Nitrosomonas sp.]|uniref:N-acetylneuraminate synthase family protein n=1 Tax=Nitrosomonas sp. TaxID=42353 RepID=UPI0025FA8D9F|nr:N-acetylneuraminate synthase family protein [Nitrosomonas sp.]